MRKGKPEGISVAAFAREVSVTAKAVRDRVKAGRMDGAVFEDGSLDHGLARALWYANTNPNRAKPRAENKPTSKLFDESEEAGAEGGKVSEYDLKVRRMKVDLETAEIGLDMLRKSTVDRAEALRAVRALMRVHRNTLLNFASRYGPEIAAECGGDERKLIGALEARMRTALVEAAQQPVPFDEDAPPAATADDE